MYKIWQFFVRTSAFIGKELIEVIRQTPLILTLVLGPFLILLLFGIGYTNEARPLRTIFLLEEDNPTLRQQIEENVADIGPQLVYLGITNSRNEAVAELNQGRADLIVSIPADAITMMENNQQVTINLYHNEIDPYQVAYIESFGNIYVEAINERLLQSVAVQGQQEIAGILPKVEEAHQQADSMQQTLEQGQSEISDEDFDALTETMDTLLISAEGNLGLLASVNSSMAENGSSSNSEGDVQNRINEMRTEMETLQNLKSEGGNIESSIQSLDSLKSDLEQMQQLLSSIQSVEPQVMIAPFTSETSAVGNVSISPESFFAPGVVILLLQHLAVTFASLTIVREIRLGSMEVFRISPITAIEILIGKYISYLVIGAVVGTAITLTLVYLLGVPMLGNWGHYALVLFAVVFASIGMGFLLSLIAKTDLQAVQYAMFLLLGSVFFSGFFMDLRYFLVPVRIVSWILPATYGIQMLQDIMLRGQFLPLNLILPLLGFGIGLFLLVWILLRRIMRKRPSD